MSFEEKLINIVKNHESLYNLAHKAYKNVIVKELLWEDIASELQTTAATCKTKWKNLRDTYRKEKRKENIKSGSGQQAPKKKWKYYDTLTFLDQYANERQTIGNVEEKAFHVIMIDEATREESWTEGNMSSSTVLENSGLEAQSLSPRETTPSQLHISKKITSSSAKPRKSSSPFPNKVDCNFLDSIKQAGDVIASKKSQVAATSTHKLFKTLADKITTCNMPLSEINKVEMEVTKVVYDAMLKC